MPLPRATLGLFVTLAAVGCGKLDRVGECRALAKAVNPALDAVESLAKKNSYQGYRDASKEYTALVARLRTLRLTTAPAKDLAEEYTAALAEVPPRLSAYAEAVRAGDDSRRDESARELERITRRERAAATRIAAHCAGR